MASRSKSDKYWLANCPNGQVTDAQVVALKSLSDADLDELDDLAAALPMAAEADAAAMTSSDASGGEDATEAEYNALRADVVAVRAKLNAILAKMRTAKLLTS